MGSYIFSNIGFYSSLPRFAASSSFRYMSALPNIQIVNENLKFGYEIAQVLLNTPSIASWAHEPS